jgi:hypothetical protein
MRVAIGSDHAGFALKEAVQSFLAAERREVLDLGTHSTDPVDYSDCAEAVGRALRANQAECGILLCGSGTPLRGPPRQGLVVCRSPARQGPLRLRGSDLRHEASAAGRQIRRDNIPFCPQAKTAAEGVGILARTRTRRQ